MINDNFIKDMRYSYRLRLRRKRKLQYAVKCIGVGLVGAAAGWGFLVIWFSL